MKNVAVIFGGQSAEHEISKMSAASVMRAIPEDKYKVIPVYITEEGRWLLYDGSIENIKGVRWDKLGTDAIMGAGADKRGVLRVVGDKVKNIPVDIVFPVLHGKNGEDGAIQGLLELQGLPYAGCGVLASAVSLDKAYTKIIAAAAGVEQAPYLVFNRREADAPEKISKIAEEARKSLGAACFVKIASGGSSIGVWRAATKKALTAALKEAFELDRRVVIEKEIKGRELECAVLGKPGNLTVSPVGEAVPAAEFYDFDAKYKSEESKTVVPAAVPEKVSEEVRGLAARVFEAVDGYGLARVDFFYDEAKQKVYFNEINTMPGFTAISMYPVLMEKSGVKLPELLDKLLVLACERGKTWTTDR
ncbi:MAG: D-alanine--D-alanine ligase [Clostridiales bacterium]|jgi:D-alanine-D-alanine ligase|nr:D-alanine--D-alanine ligase [Clostridiales bacterium]